ncbi:MAG: 2-aminoadipate aminotransferase [Burkholderiaceae bacterium]|nr:2-aminoadipate aminotransferase [Burkholderiaceae bacterium]
MGSNPFPAAGAAAAPADLPAARRAAHVQGSLIREILKATMRPGMISLAGGLPAPQSFPAEALRAAFDAVLATEPAQALQYSTTEGHPPLREWIAAQESARGVPTAAEQVLVVSGSQQALDLIGKAMVDEGQPLLVESPTYLGALQAFAPFGPALRQLPADEAGLLPQAIDGGLARGARLAYVMPSFQNPTGRTLGAERRSALAQAARRFDLWLVEDDPYGELWYREAPPASLRLHAPERTLRVGSFLLARLKQATDLHTATLTQHVVARVLRDGLLDAQLPRVRRLYASRAAAMLAALRAHMPDGVRWTEPQGGMFVWLTVPAAVDTLRLLDRAIAAGVAFVPGAPFYADSPRRDTLRLSFVTVPDETIDRGVAILARLVNEEANR